MSNFICRVHTSPMGARVDVPCRIIGETARRYRVELLAPSFSGRRMRPAGYVTQVEKHHVRAAQREAVKP